MWLFHQTLGKQTEQMCDVGSCVQHVFPDSRSRHYIVADVFVLFLDEMPRQSKIMRHDLIDILEKTAVISL